MEIGTSTGPYRIDSLLGRGGMAEVYRAWHGGLHRFEALKALPPQMTFDRSFVERFLQEARTAAGLQHPNIAAIHAVSDVGAPQPYFTMELVEGGDLADLLAARGLLGLEEALPILRQVGAALDYAHSRGVIHRDVKPANVLLKSQGSGHTVKVVDFGIARSQEEKGGTRLTQAGVIVGTPEYLSPEQAGNGEVVDARTDQYSLGVVAYEMLCGRPPFGNKGDSALSVIMGHVRDQPRPPVEAVPGLPADASNAILKALSKKPADRFSSCDEFVKALLPAAPMVVPKSQRTWKMLPVVPTVAGAALLAGVGLVAMGLTRSGEHPSASGDAIGSPVVLTPMRDAVTSTPRSTPPQVLTHFLDVTATASKTVRAKGYNYGPDLVLDGRKDTAWNVHNSHHGIGEWIQISWPEERTVAKIGVDVGYEKYNYKAYYSGQPNMWFRNNRLRRATLRFSGGEARDVDFNDKIGVQLRSFSPVRAHWVKIIVDDVYLDMYGGQQKRWDDLAISEIQFWGHI